MATRTGNNSPGPLCRHALQSCLRMMKFPAAASVALFLAFAADSPPSLHTGEIVVHLARTIAWYRHVVAVEQSALPPADLLAPDGPKSTATRALQLAFDFAR